jgi:hypothetical protein
VVEGSEYIGTIFTAARQINREEAHLPIEVNTLPQAGAVNGDRHKSELVPTTVDSGAKVLAGEACVTRILF